MELSARCGNGAGGIPMVTESPPELLLGWKVRPGEAGYQQWRVVAPRATAGFHGVPPALG